VCAKVSKAAQMSYHLRAQKQDCWTR